MNARHVSVVGLLLGTLLLGACASVPMATPEEDALAKQATPPQGKALVYLYRNEMLGAAITIPVTLDGRLAGETAANSYFLWTVAPGRHEIVSTGENTSALPLKCEAGKSYYVWQEMKMGALRAGTKLHPVDAKTGRDAINDCKLIKGNF